MRIIETIAELRAVRRSLPGGVGVVPTMGALHAGHLALVEAARSEHETVMVTVFVNPLQFAGGEDFERYPRDLARDLALLEAAGTDVVFTPTPALMYPPGFQTRVTVAEVTQGLEGAARPGHFDGVATVVTKLFNLTQPTAAYFGQKDAQQVVVIRRLVRDLDLPVEIAVCPTVRADDGLALSSRNVYLTAEQRTAAPVVYRALNAAADAYDAGKREPARLLAAARSTVEGEPLAALEYLALSDPHTLRDRVQADDTPALLSVTVRFGATRLLDNLLLPRRLNTRAGLNATLGAPN